MEIYRNANSANRTVRIPFGEDITDAIVTLKGVDDGEDYVMNDVTITDDVVEFVVPLRFAKWDRLIPVEILSTYTEDTVEYEDTYNYDVKVSTPILPLDVIKDILTTPGFDDVITDDDVRAIERATRFIIQSNTGQDFGYYKESRTFGRLHGHGLTELPGRLIDATTLDGKTLTNDLRTTHSQRFIYRSQHSNYNLWDGTPTIINGAIYNPRSDTYERVGQFSAGWSTIHGEWGWKSVPEAVQEAAKLLVNDYACSEAAYRDRYLGVMKAADWEINFRSGAWAATGNVRADQLLRDYTITGGIGVL